ncbi:DUF2769 domain-containing protein [Methanosarcina sp. Z-7115]|uniref:DUF2769 domain-containing protein n=1 Tax=Methanosarcina baikalica TaxID=3073890 RepID=A0ABU2D2Q7_9EURY|nr:DUF2769 domain-containing protein [Methanosarcina sp. Z-7115]MDR7666270.1 DUF2769 domain-containing protein [Methanosarcina sp. Z-7115]
MTTAVETKVPYNVLNIERCMCSQCPVQAASICARETFSSLKNEIKLGEAPEPQKVPGVYCSTGAATCVDLNPNKQCICKTCAVWGDYCLEHANPMMYFCTIGRAD